MYVYVRGYFSPISGNVIFGIQNVHLICFEGKFIFPSKYDVSMGN